MLPTTHREIRARASHLRVNSGLRSMSTCVLRVTYNLLMIFYVQGPMHTIMPLNVNQFFENLNMNVSLSTFLTKQTRLNDQY